MNISHILLICILWIIFLMIFNTLYIMLYEYTLNINFKNEHINNDLPDNQVTQMGDANLLIPTSEQVYNPNDTNRIDNTNGHQVTDINNVNINTDYADTDPSIPIVYVNDELETTNNRINTPSSLKNVIDTGSGVIELPENIYNNALNNFRGIE